MKAQRIRIEHMRNPLGIDVKQPLVSWNGADGIRQVSYRVKAMGSLGTTYDSGMVKSSEMQTRIPAEFKSRERVAVSVLLNEEEEGAQEVNAFFEMGLGEAGDWKAKWINPEEEVPDKDGLRPASYLRKRFVISDLTGENSARLYATAHGVYNIYINGKHVDGFVMAPGVSEYNNLLQYQTYDVTELLQEGENEILAVLGNGWWRGTVTYDGFKNTFGEDVALLAQLELNGRIICMSDDTWEANQDGPLRDTDNMQGEVYDAVRELSDANWHPVQTADFGYENLRSSNCPYATEHETFKPTLLVTPRGEKVLDFGQNIAGYIGFDIKAHEGEQYCFSHGETLDGDGNFTIDNFQSCNYISRQEIRYTCKEGRNVYRPTNTFMGFRYVKVEGMEQINPEDFTAYAVYTDLEETLRFSCGHELVNQLVKNASWSLKGNLLDIPTDCPTREKSGFTGDLVTYVHTFLYQMDAYPMLGKFIENQAVSQYEDGCVKQIVADPRERGPMDGAGGWCSSFDILPARVGERYNDYHLFETFYPQIKKWADFLLARAASSTRPENEENPFKDYLDDVGIHWGEWVEPGFDFPSYFKNIMENGEPEVGTAYMAYTCQMVSAQAKRMGKEEESAYYAQAAEKVKQAYRYKFTENGKIDSPRMCRYIRPIILNLLDEEEKKEAAAQLNRLVEENGYKLNTGFLSTHELCRTLSQYGYIDTAYRLLLQEEQPGWLYPVKCKMTTIPESWEPFLPDGSVQSSFNHYSYGAVTGWLVDTAAGIRLKDGKLTITPKPSSQLGWMDVTWQSPVGEVRSAWKYEGEKIRYQLEIPSNVQAEVEFAKGERRVLTSGSYEFLEEV